MYQRNGCIINKRGAITVFLALIFMSLIIFAGTVIDIARITAADRKVQSALNTSARSVLADYDRELMGSYGIYGVDTAREDVKKDFYRYISVNLRERHKNMNFIEIDLDYEDIEIQGMESLLKYDTFKRQILEYMKYRTPILLADTLIEQLKNIKLDKKIAFAKSEKITRDKARELRNKVNEVNAKLAGIKQSLKDLSVKKLEKLKSELSEVLEINGLIYFGDNEGLLIDYIQSKNDTNIKAEEDEYIGNQSEEFDSVKESSENLTPGIQGYLTEIDRTLSEIKPLQKELELMEKELKSLKSELSKLKERLSDVREDDVNIEEEIDEVKEDIDEVKKKTGQLKSQIDNEISQLKMKLEEIALEGYFLKAETVQLDYNKSEELKSFINSTKEEIEKALPKRIEKDWLIAPEEFEDNSIVGEDLGGMDESAYLSPSMPEKEAERRNDEIIRIMERLADTIEDIASSASEKISIIEYVMDNYTFLTSKTERNHYFSKGEVEYIIGGSDIGEGYSRIKNTEYYIVTKVLLQVWALRFAIDTVDAFIRSTVIFPPQRLAFALVEGALDSSLDMFNLLNGESVPICHESFTAVKLKYSDHLRILLLMKPEEEILRKARQLIQVNIKKVVDAETGLPRSDFRLGDYSTVISASVKAKVNLFFLPLLKVDKLLPGRFEDGKYIIQKQIYVGY